MLYSLPCVLLDKLSAFSCISCSLLQTCLALILVSKPTDNSTQNEFNHSCNIFKKLDAVYILDIHPSREKQEDYNNITSDIIINELPNGFHINIDEAHILSKYDNAVFVFLSPNDLSELESELINLKRGL